MEKPLEVTTLAVTTASREGGIFLPLDFLSAEALGTDLPRRCVSCLGCKECKFRADSISFKENQEYQVILKGAEHQRGNGQVDGCLSLLRSPHRPEGQL